MILENIDDVKTQIYFLECLDEVMLNTLLQRVKNEKLKNNALSKVSKTQKGGRHRR